MRHSGFPSIVASSHSDQQSSDNNQDDGFHDPPLIDTAARFMRFSSDTREALIMASATIRQFDAKSANITEQADEKKTAQFLAALTELSRTFGIGIAGDAVLFTMETGPESDYERTFRMDREGRLSFV